MISRQHSRLGVGLLLAVGLASSGLGACSSSSGPGQSSGGSAPGPSGGNHQGTSGSVGSSGTASGGMASGGTASASGGTASGGTASGGTTSGGTASGGTASGGTASGGKPGSAGAGGKSASGGAGPGTGGGSGTCQKGQVKPAEVVIMGESFYAIDPKYNQKRIEENARKAGSLGANESYRNVAVSGQNMNYIATTEWTEATKGGASVKFVIMDGGGIDCLSGGSTCATCKDTFKTLLGKMATAGVQDVIYTRYPEPGAPPGSDAKLKACLDSTMPGMQTTCEGSTAPRCHWVDLRPVFVAGDTTDGLHPTASGGQHVGDLIWSEMVKLCLAQ